MNAYDIILKPVMSEKAYDGIHKKIYTFKVAGRSEGYTSKSKKAVVKLTSDSKAIEFFESLA